MPRKLNDRRIQCPMNYKENSDGRIYRSENSDC